LLRDGQPRYILQRSSQLSASLGNPRHRPDSQHAQVVEEHTTRGDATNGQHMIKPAVFATKLDILPEYAGVSKHIRPIQSGSNHNRATTYSCIIWEETKQSQHPQS